MYKIFIQINKIPNIGYQISYTVYKIHVYNISDYYYSKLDILYSIWDILYVEFYKISDIVLRI